LIKILIINFYYDIYLIALNIGYTGLSVSAATRRDFIFISLRM